MTEYTRHFTHKEPDAYCVTLENGECISNDPRCMHQPKPMPCVEPVATVSKTGKLLAIHITKDHIGQDLYLSETVAALTAENAELKSLIWKLQTPAPDAHKVKGYCEECKAIEAAYKIGKEFGKEST